uniref:Uncharacterized protein n=1 Tax=Romanomermis culicivorax TaxID=13658 RepID=A0A915L6D3_ROMCU
MVEIRTNRMFPSMADKLRILENFHDLDIHSPESVEPIASFGRSKHPLQPVQQTTQTNLHCAHKTIQVTVLSLYWIFNMTTSIQINNKITQLDDA